MLRVGGSRVHACAALLAGTMLASPVLAQGGGAADPSAPLPPGASADDLQRRLAYLKGLWDKGLINEQDYNQYRHRVLDEVVSRGGSVAGPPTRPFPPDAPKVEARSSKPSAADFKDRDKGLPGLYDDYRLDFSGYLRAGIGGNHRGGDQVCFRVPGARSKYRLGNECEVFSELQLDALVKETKSGARFSVTTLLAYLVEGEGDFEQTEPAFRQAWVGADNVFGGPLKDTVFWGGKRFYKRNDVHMIDFYYWDATGTGAGIENVDLGWGKFSYAWFRNSEDDFDEFTVADDLGSPRIITDERTQVSDRAVSRHDFRLTDIKTNPGGTFMIGGDIRVAEENRDGFRGRDGFFLTAQHNQEIGAAVTNGLVVQYGQGSGSTLSNQPDDMLGGGTRTWRLIDFVNVSSLGDFSAQAVVLYEAQSGGDPADRRDWFSIGARPIYHFNENVALALEVGHDRVMPEIGDTRTLTKVTLAPMIKAGKQFFDRPELRLFVTYADWNRAARDAGLEGTGLEDGTSSITFGAQIETWW